MILAWVVVVAFRWMVLHQNLSLKDPIMVLNSMIRLGDRLRQVQYDPFIKSLLDVVRNPNMSLSSTLSRSNKVEKYIRKKIYKPIVFKVLCWGDINPIFWLRCHYCGISLVNFPFKDPTLLQLFFLTLVTQKSRTFKVWYFVRKIQHIPSKD